MKKKSKMDTPKADTTGLKIVETENQLKVNKNDNINHKKLMILMITIGGVPDEKVT